MSMNEMSAVLERKLRCGCSSSGRKMTTFSAASLVVRPTAAATCTRIALPEGRSSEKRDERRQMSGVNRAHTHMLMST
jgi:hypothetical protein